MDKLIELFRTFDQSRDKRYFFLDQKSQLSLEIRKILMTLRTCMERYGNHIEAFKEDNKMTEMIRVTYIEEILEIEVPEED
jgi:hypothetical protein